MREPLDDLSDLRGIDVDPLPASEIRLRGDRLRRRRNALTVTGAAAAVAAVALTASLVGGGVDRSSPAPATNSPSADATQEAAPVPIIPDDVPLDSGLPAENLDGSRVAVTSAPGVEPLDLCGEAVLDTAGAADVAGVTYSGGEDYRARTLLAFASAAEAEAYVARTDELVGVCPETEDTVGVLLVEPVEAQLGEESVAFATRYKSNDGPLTGLTVHHVARMHSTVLITSQSGEVGNTTANRATYAADAGTDAAALLAEVTGTSPSTDPTSAAVATEIPADFPLDVDLQAMEGDGGELTGPSADAPGLGTVDVCGVSAWTDEPQARLAVNATGPEYEDAREVRVLASADEAVAQMSALRAAVEGCPEEQLDGGGALVRTTFDEDTGYETITFSSTYTEGLGGTVQQFVRVGSAILATSIYGEFGPEVDPSSVRERTDLAGRITPSMCVFTEAGC
jgi:hypothetical protein